MDQQDILYNSVWFDCCSQHAHSAGSFQAPTVTFCCNVCSSTSASLLAFGSVSALLLFICICASCFCLSSSPTRPHGSLRHFGSQLLFLSLSVWVSLSLPFSHALIVHLTSSLWCLSECQAGRPWSDLAGNELLITSQETQHSTPILPPSPHPMQHTHTSHTHTNYTAIVCSAHKEK